MSVRNKESIVRDSVSLVSVRIITLTCSVIATSILSHGTDIQTYGVYSQGNLLISFLTTISILGFTDGVNFFYNRSDDVQQRKKYIDTLFGVQLIIGVVLMSGVLLLQDAIAVYFRSPEIKLYLIYLCFRPMLSNFSAMLQNLCVSVGKARKLALRSAVTALCKVLAVCICVFFTKDIGTVFQLLLLLDVLGTLYFYWIYAKEDVHIRFAIDKTLLREIFDFCIPMGLYVITNSLCRECDKLVVARMGGTEALALYTNATFPIPVNLVPTAMITVIIPTLTRLYHQNKLELSRELLACFLKLGYISSAVFGMACLVLAQPIILFLYGAKYLPGLRVFQVYMIVDILKFANVSFLLSIAGRTRELLKSSLIILLANMVMNIVGYTWLGIAGPAIATLITAAVNVAYLLIRGADVLQIKSTIFFDWKHVAVFSAQLLACSGAAGCLQKILTEQNVGAFWQIAICGAGLCGCMFLLNLRVLKTTLASINNIGEKNK